MKFLCDRCKTRYSIGDERVRGKILKIRCKNCANVITVREGMPEPDAGAARRTKATTQAPMPAVEPAAAAAAGPAAAAPARDGALGAAFASAMSKPPPVLEEEWYVSIDGDQAGPFSLAEAQHWVASKPFEAELYCWSEGFDDWLLVEKVSHFRGLRTPARRPAPQPAPPPLPRSGSGPARAALAATPQPHEDEPKPLFAATMASLEKSVAPAAAPRLMPSPQPSATPPLGNGSYTNGAALAKPATPAAPRPALGFDASEGAAESATQIEARPFDELRESAGGGDPAGSARGADGAAPNDAFFAAARAAADEATTASPPAVEPDADDIDIGEVSRVVNLADLVPSARRSGPIPSSGPIPNPNPGAAAAGAAPAGLARTASMPRIVAAPGGADAGALGAPVADVSSPAVATVHRRGMIALLIGAGVLVGAAIIVVVLMLDRKSAGSDQLGDDYELNTQRPDPTIVRRQPWEPPPKPEENPVKPRKQPWRPVTPRPPDRQPDPPAADALKPDEIEAMAAKYNGTTTSCWRRSQRGAEGILLADVKKILVTLTVAADGTVSSVQLSDGHASNKLGKCLITAIRSWKFRESAGGTFRITLHFG